MSLHSFFCFFTLSSRMLPLPLFIRFVGFPACPVLAVFGRSPRPWGFILCSQHRKIVICSKTNGKRSSAATVTQPYRQSLLPRSFTCMPFRFHSFPVRLSRIAPCVADGKSLWIGSMCGQNMDTGYWMRVYAEYWQTRISLVWEKRCMRHRWRTMEPYSQCACDRCVRVALYRILVLSERHGFRCAFIALAL